MTTVAPVEQSHLQPIASASPRPQRRPRRGAAQRNTRVDTSSGRVFRAGLSRSTEINGEQNTTAPNATAPSGSSATNASAPASSSRRQRTRHNRPRQPTPTNTRSNDDDAPAPTPAPTQRSTASDITTRLHHDIQRNIYECPICTANVGRRSHIWYCSHCWTVFHLKCIRKWAGNEGSSLRQPGQQQQEQQEGQIGYENLQQWRCPGCNLAHDAKPSVYTCWCGKDSEPRSLPGLPPHSCGQTCSKSRSACPHPCDAVCHAGPCARCTAMGPTKTCYCARKESRKKCIERNYEQGWSCGEVCGEMLPCAQHFCRRECHDGLCGECEEAIDATCYCGKANKMMSCGKKKTESESQRSDGSQWIGVFECGQVCNRVFDCGIHTCRKTCHPQDADATHCPESPDLVTHCPCGKTLLDKFKNYTPRRSCADPIPSCDKPCSRNLPCGHKCERLCHTGPCPPCPQSVTVTCRCGRVPFKSRCGYGTMKEPPQCLHICKATMNCGRHVCGEHCCTGERHAIERTSARKKPVRTAPGTSVIPTTVLPTNSPDDIEAEHICLRTCGRLLRCGNHTCPELCHRGPCNNCREAIFDEISCSCGRSILYPPLPCGTKPPACTFNCTRVKPCGHQQTPHNCHGDDEECPKCPFLTEKKCVCGKTVMKNQPCYISAPRCGRVCGRPLSCGAHTCRKTCHPSNGCEDQVDPGSKCRQICGKDKTLCPHKCAEPCHAPSVCPESKPCATMVTLTCPCGRVKQDKRCSMSQEKHRALKERAVAEGTMTSSIFPPTQYLQPPKCDDECSRLERRRALALAFNKPLPSEAEANLDSSSPLPYSPETMSAYLDIATPSTVSLLTSYEASLLDLALSTECPKAINFPSARAPFRAFIHALAHDWKFVSRSLDREPSRYVEVFKPTRWAPPPSHIGVGLASIGHGIGIGGLSVGECVRLQERQELRERETRRTMRAQSANPPTPASTNLKNNNIAGGREWVEIASGKNKPANTAPSTITSGGSSTTGRFAVLAPRKTAASLNRDTSPLPPSQATYSKRAADPSTPIPGAEGNVSTSMSIDGNTKTPATDTATMKPPITATKPIKFEDVADDWEAEVADDWEAEVADEEAKTVSQILGKSEEEKDD